jgi:hypothetical protein
LATHFRAAEIRVRAERKMGELLEEMEKQGPGQYQQRSSDATVDIPPTLVELGITKDQSSRWQQLAKVPKEKFDQHLEQAREAKIPICTTFILDEERRRRMPKRDRAKEREAKERNRRAAEENDRILKLIEALENLASIPCSPDVHRHRSSINPVRPPSPFDLPHLKDVTDPCIQISVLCVYIY